MNQGRLSGEFRNRTKAYAAGVIRLYVHLPKVRDEVRVLGRQLLRSGTSVAAQVREASRARSNDEFVSKLGGALQEADETQLWLELLREECGIEPASTRPLETESSELMAIVTTMINRTKNRNPESKKQKIKIVKAKNVKVENKNGAMALSEDISPLSAFQISVL